MYSCVFTRFTFASTLNMLCLWLCAFLPLIQSSSMFPRKHFPPVCEFLVIPCNCAHCEHGSFEVLSLHKEPTNVSPVAWDRSRSPLRCEARRRWQSAVRKGFLNGTDVVSIAAPPRCTVEIACNQVNKLTKHNGTDCESALFLQYTDNTVKFSGS